MTDLSKGPPPIPLDLVEYLEKVWPDRFPNQVLGESYQAIAADVLRHAGRLEVVRFLRAHLQRQAVSPAADSKKSKKTKASA